MVDIINKPFFHYDEALASLNQPFQRQANVRMIGFSRMYANKERFLVTSEKEWTLDFYTHRQLYKIGLYERPLDQILSGFNMWDHLPYAPPEIYAHTRKTFGFAHGLTIVRNEGTHCDSFVFVTSPGNTEVNNFYLNEKEQFVGFIDRFYRQMSHELEFLREHAFSVPLPLDHEPSPLKVKPLTARQKEIAYLLCQGLFTKQIAHEVDISTRTVENHLDILRCKFQARNRAELVYVLKGRI